MKISRRAVAKASLAAPALIYQLQSESLWAAGNTFEGDAGVASGSPRPESVVIWTRVPGVFRNNRSRSVNVHFEMATTADFLAGEIVAQGDLSTSALRDFTVKTRVTGLLPFTTYYYRFTTTSGYSSVIGRTKTAPAPGADISSIKVGVVACQRYSGGYYPAYTHLAKEDLDYCVHLGDHIYEIESGRARPDIAMNGAVAKTLDDFRLKYRFYLSDPAWREARRLFPWIDLWDDHEVVDNYAGPSLGQSNAPLLTNGYQAFCEYMPTMEQLIPNARGPSEVRIYDQFSFGSLIDMFVLDQRQYRSDCACEDDFMTAGCDNMGASSNTMLGANQKSWFKNQLQESTGKWKLVLSEVVFAKFFVPSPNPNVHLPDFAEDLEGFKAQGDKVYLNLDAWDGYPAERLEILKHISDNTINNVVFVSGDVHSAYNSKLLLKDTDTKAVALEIVTAPISSAPLQRGMTRFFGEDCTPAILESNPWTVWADVTHNGYTVLTANRDKLVVEHKIVASTATAESDLSTMRTVEIRDGRLEFSNCSP